MLLPENTHKTPQPFDPKPSGTVSGTHPSFLRRRLLIGVIGVFITLGIVPLLVGVCVAGRGVAGILTMTSRLHDHANHLELVAVSHDLDTMDGYIQDIHRGLGITLWWQTFPWFGTQMRAINDVARLGTQTINAVRPLLEAAESLQEAATSFGLTHISPTLGAEPQRAFYDLSRDEKRTLLRHLDQSLSSLRETRDRLSIAAESWKRLPTDELLSPMQRAFSSLSDRVIVARDEINQSLALLEIGLPFVGYPAPHTFLVLLQNADELRPSGGFIGTIGLVHADSGDLGSMAFGDVYGLDRLVEGRWHDEPPEPLKRELGVQAWYLRDANWSPDVPMSATKIMDVFARERSLAGFATTTIDGVILLEPGFFRDVLRVSGPLFIDGHRFDADHFFDALEYEVEQGFLTAGKPVTQRKEIVAKIGQALVARLMEVPAQRWPELLGVVSRALERKDAMIVVRDPKLLAAIDARGWSGRIQPTSQDYLMVVDANLAALKTDGAMQKQIAYQTDMTDPTHPIGIVTLTYTNTASAFSWRYTRYRDYVRVYVPEGSELIASDGAMLNDKTKTGGLVVPGNVDTFHDLGKSVFGAFWAVEPGETRHLTFRYRLPQSASPINRLYTLLVQRQPGANTRLTLDLAFGKKLVSASPSEIGAEHGDDRYRLTMPLEQDARLSVQLGE